MNPAFVSKDSGWGSGLWCAGRQSLDRAQGWCELCHHRIALNIKVIEHSAFCVGGNPRVHDPKGGTAARLLPGMNAEKRRGFRRGDLPIRPSRVARMLLLDES